MGVHVGNEMNQLNFTSVWWDRRGVVLILVWPNAATAFPMTNGQRSVLVSPHAIPVFGNACLCPGNKHALWFSRYSCIRNGCTIWGLPSYRELFAGHRFVYDPVSVVRSPNLMAAMKRYRVVAGIQRCGVWAAHAFGQAFGRCPAFAALRHTCAPVLRVAFECGECLAYPFPNRWPIDPFPKAHHQSATLNPMIALYLTSDHCPIQTLTKWRVKNGKC